MIIYSIIYNKKIYSICIKHNKRFKDKNKIIYKIYIREIIYEITYKIKIKLSNI